MILDLKNGEKILSCEKCIYPGVTFDGTGTDQRKIKQTKMVIEGLEDQDHQNEKYMTLW